MRIMTSNIWGDYFGNEVSSRENQLSDVFEKYDADVIGMQEVTDSWYKSSIFKKLSEKYMLIGTELFNNTNYVPIAIKKSFNLIAKGFEYLENTPDKSKSISWAVFENGDKKVAVCNTHFWWMDGNQSESDKKILKPHIGEVAYWSKSQHDELRTKNAKQLSALMKQLGERFNCTVFAFGDMNTTISSDVFKVYGENNIKRLFDLTDEKDTVCSIHGNPKRGADGKFHGEKTKDDYNRSIDHIVGLGDDFSVKQYRIVEEQNALDVTDHSPVYADIILK